VHRNMYKRYKHLVIQKSDDPPTAAEIRKIERVLGAKLPADFLDFLFVGNGSYLGDYLITVPLKPNAQVMTFSLFTTKRGPDSFLNEIKSQRTSYIKTPEKVLPIAQNGGGSYLYLDLRERGTSPVVAFIHGLPVWTGLPQQDELIKIADNFSDYLDLLQFDADYNKSLLVDAIAAKDDKRIAACIEYLDSALPGWRQTLGVDIDRLSP